MRSLSSVSYAASDLHENIMLHNINAFIRWKETSSALFVIKCWRVSRRWQNTKVLFLYTYFFTVTSINLFTETHTEELNFICDVCNKGFKTKKYLKRHYVVHTGEKNYACSVCNEKFTYNVLLKSHFAKMHPNFEMPPSGTLMSERAIKRMDEDYKKFLKIQTIKDPTDKEAVDEELKG
jgi:hypothetical protein